MRIVQVIVVAGFAVAALGQELSELPQLPRSSVAFFLQQRALKHHKQVRVDAKQRDEARKSILRRLREASAEKHKSDGGS